MQEQEKIEILRDLLFADDKKQTEILAKKIEQLQSVINERKNLSEKVDPIVDEKIQEFAANIPNQLGPAITEALREEIKNSQDAVVEVLFPIIGKMIKKYVAHEMKILSERISNQTKNAFSFKRFLRKTKAQASGASAGEFALTESAKPKIIQFFIIEKDSGLLVASQVTEGEDKIDEDMIAGMLTAIKNFVEDAFQGGAQNLEHIEYELYDIHIQTFYKYYIAVVLSGAYTAEYKKELEDQLLDFAEQNITKKELQNQELLSSKLKKYFNDEIV